MKANFWSEESHQHYMNCDTFLIVLMGPVCLLIVLVTINIPVLFMGPLKVIKIKGHTENGKVMLPNERSYLSW